MAQKEQIAFSADTRSDVRSAVMHCVNYRIRVSVYFGNPVSGAIRTNSKVVGEFVVVNSQIAFKTTNKRVEVIDTSVIVCIEVHNTDLAIYNHPTLYSIERSHVNKQKNKITIPDGWPTVRDPHHMDSVEWTYYQGDFYHKNTTQCKWVRSGKSHLTPNRIVMFHALLNKLQCIES